MHQNVKLGWIGFHVEGVPALRALAESGVRLEGIITLEHEALAKRSGGFNYEPVARELNLPLFRVKDINSEPSLQLLRQMDLDIAIVLGWSQILKAETLKLARIGMIGAHASLLPHNRGSAPINWAIIKGETTSGNTLIWLADSVDEGPIIDQTEFAITPYDTCATLYDKVAASNRDMLLRLVPDLLSGNIRRRPQPALAEPPLPRRRPGDGLIDWRGSSQALYDFIRALTRPYPGAFGFLAGRKWTLWKAGLLAMDPPLSSAAPPGQVLGSVVSPDEHACGQIVSCGSGAILLLEVEDEAGHLYSGAELSELDWRGLGWNLAAKDL